MKIFVENGFSNEEKLWKRFGIARRNIQIRINRSGKRRLELAVGGSLLFLFFIFLPFKVFVIEANSSYSSLTENEINDVEEETCSPQSHVMFLKTHKCGSSAIQNILMRYGYNNNLTFALPRIFNYLGHPEKFKTGMIPSELLPESQLVDIFCMHTRLDPIEMKDVLHPDTTWVTIVRNPVSQFESQYIYFSLKWRYKIDLASFNNENAEELKKISRGAFGMGKNQMLFDLGIDEDIGLDELQLKLEQLDSIFDIVMIMEKMEESLILLMHKMCWTLEDMVVFTNNALRTELKKELPEESQKAIKYINKADSVLYDYYLKRHQENVIKFGEEKMEDEVRALKKLTKQYYQECVQERVMGLDDRLTYKQDRDLVYGFIETNNTREICHWLTITEVPFINKIRERQQVYVKNEKYIDGNNENNDDNSEYFY